MATQLEINEVTALYEDILFRAPDSAGLTFWSGILDSGLLTIQQMMNVFSSSAEALNNVDPIIRLYTGLLGRTPDIAGLTGWVAAADSGTSFNTIVQNFVSSQEFANDYNGGTLGPIPTANATAFVEALYFHFLNRSGDSAGVTGWVNVLTNNGAGVTVASEAAVVEAFVNSPEYLNDIQNNVVAWVTAGAVSGQNNTTSTTVGTPTYPSSITGAVNSFVLTTGADHVSNVTNVFGDLTAFLFNGVGPTLNSDDVISNVTNLVLTDDYGQGVDIIPAGAQLSNITNITLNTSGNAGGGVGIIGGGSGVLDVSGITAVQNLVVNSAGSGIDNVNAGPTTTITINHKGTGESADDIPTLFADIPGSVIATGGSAVTVTSFGSGAVLIGAESLGSVPLTGQTPTGAVSVTENGTGSVHIEGGTSVTVLVTESSNDGFIEIGNTWYNTDDSSLGGFTNPTGPVTVTDHGIDGLIRIEGGSTVNVTGVGDEIIVGSNGANALINNTTGDIVVTNTAAIAWTNTTGEEENVTARGGDNVTVTTNTGDVFIGDTEGTTNTTGTAPQPGVQPTGDIVVIDTATNHDAEVEIAGGVNVNVVASGIDVEAGFVDGGVVFAPTGAIGISDIAATPYDDILNTDEGEVDVDGGTNVIVATNSGGAFIGEDTATPLPGSDPSGTVSVVDTATGLAFEDTVEIFGGTNIISVTVAGSVIVGDGSAASDPTGNVNISEIGIDTGYHYFNEIDVAGGVNVVIETTGAGDGIGVGSNVLTGGTPITGTVDILDTYSGRHNDDISVIGGTTVQINDTATSLSFFGGGGAVDVGLAPTQNATGTALTNTADDPTGNVTVNSSSVFGTTTYGAGAMDIFTNGATSVSLTGGVDSDSTIEDVQSTILTGTGLPAGTSTLASISLTGFSDSEVDITDNALATLSISNETVPSGDSVDVFIENTAASSGLAIALASSDAFVEDDDSEISGTIAVTTTGTALDILELDAPKATGLTFDNASPLVFIADGIGDVTSITASGGGALALGDLSGDTKLASITASTATGGVLVEINPANTAFTGGSGNDAVYVTQNALGTGITLNGGGGSNTIYADYTAAGTDQPLGNIAHVQNFQNFGVASVDNAASGIYNGEGFSNVIVGTVNLDATGYDGVSGAITFSNLAQGAALTLLDTSGEDVTYQLQTAFTAPGAVSIQIGKDGTNPAIPAPTIATSSVDAPVVSIADTTAGPSNNIGTVNIDSQGWVAPGNVNTLLLELSALSAGNVTINISGDQSLLLQTGPVVATVSAVNAGASTAPEITIQSEPALSVVTAGTGVTFTGGSGVLTAGATEDGNAFGSITNAAVDVFNMGTGGGDIGLGAGGAGFGIGGIGAVTNTGGSETVNLTASAPTGTIINAQVLPDGADGTRGVVNNWNQAATIATHQTADALILGLGIDGIGSAPTEPVIVVGNATNVAPVAEVGPPVFTPSGATYNISNGVFTLNGGPTPSGVQELQDVQAFLDEQGVAGLTGIVQLPSSGSTPEATYIIESTGTGLGADDTIIELNNVSGALGFGAIFDTANPADPGNMGAGASIALGMTAADLAAVFANLTDVTDTGSSTANTTVTTTNDTVDGVKPGGVAVIDTYDVAADNTFSTTYQNLGNFGVLNATTGGFDSGSIVVTQPGINPVLDFIATGDVDLVSLTYGNSAVTSDNPLLVLNSTGGFIEIASVIDASNTATTVTITGGNEVLIGGVTDTALTTINASSLGEFLDLGFTAPLAQTGLTILGSLDGGDTIAASGNTDVISVGTDAAHANTGDDVEITAAGTTDHISVVGGDFVEIAALGAGDVISVSDEGDFAEISGNGDLPPAAGAIALGANDVINVGDSSFAGDADVFVGSNNTVNMNTTAGGVTSTVDVFLANAATGALSSGTFAFTTITGVAADAGNLTLTYGTATAEQWAGGSPEDSQVNEATATSLATALDMAANQAAVIAQQFNSGSGTTVAAALEITAHTGLLDWFQYGGNTYVLEANNATGAAAAHPVMGTGDVLVELIGIVDVNHIHIA